MLLLPLPAHHSVEPLDDTLTTRLVVTTFTVTDELAVQPLLSVTVTPYEVVDEIPLTTGLDTVVDERPVEGDHK